MWLGYLAKRFGLFLIVTWAAATLNFIIPRLVPGRDPIAERLGQMAATGGFQAEGMREIVAAYQAKFGLDKPLWQQYLNYLGDLARLDLGTSISQYPAKVSTLIMNALPWTIGLLLVTTVLAFSFGTLLGALIAWPKAPKFLNYLVGPLLTLSAIPYYLFGLVLVYFLSVNFRVFPIAGAYPPGTIPQMSFSFAMTIIYHSLLPALAIILTSMGGWAIGMRGMMVTVEGEDYMTLAEANGIKPRNIFLHFALRNALLPQITSLALALGHIVSGSILVEVVFLYPGIGSVLRQAISTSDFFVIYGVVLMIVIAVGLATFILDLIYPLLDPRISYRRA